MVRHLRYRQVLNYRVKEQRKEAYEEFEILKECLTPHAFSEAINSHVSTYENQLRTHQTHVMNLDGHNLTIKEARELFTLMKVLDDTFKWHREDEWFWWGGENAVSFKNHLGHRVYFSPKGNYKYLLRLGLIYSGIVEANRLKEQEQRTIEFFEREGI